MLKNIGIYCVVTDFYKDLLKPFGNYFLNCEFDLNVVEQPNIYGDYFGNDYIKILTFKIEKIIESLKKHDIVIWSDIDIVFPYGFNIVLKDLLYRIQNFDILFSSEYKNSKQINAGFFICRSCAKTQNLFNKVHKIITNKKIIKLYQDSEPKIKYTDQNIIQIILNKSNIYWSNLPWDLYWNLTIGLPIPKNLIMAHVNGDQLLLRNHFCDKNMCFQKYKSLNLIKFKVSGKIHL